MELAGLERFQRGGRGREQEAEARRGVEAGRQARSEGGAGGVPWRRDKGRRQVSEPS